MAAMSVARDHCARETDELFSAVFGLELLKLFVKLIQDSLYNNTSFSDI
jgi:hypothetical protein